MWQARGKADCRYTVQFLDGGSHDVRVQRILPVVHGKGRGSGERGPVLKPSVNGWLRRWDNVLAFVSTPQVHGGTGAVFVLLRGS